MEAKGINFKEEKRSYLLIEEIESINSFAFWMLDNICKE